MKKFNDMTTTEQWFVSTLSSCLLEKRPDLFEGLTSLYPDEIRIIVLGNDITEIAVTQISAAISESESLSYNAGLTDGKESAVFSIQEHFNQLILNAVNKEN